MTWQQSLQAAIRALRKDEQTLEKKLAAVQRKIADLSDLAKHGGGAKGAPRSRSGSNRLSAQGRAAISRAAKARWAKFRADKKKAGRKKA